MTLVKEMINFVKGVNSSEIKLIIIISLFYLCLFSFFITTTLNIVGFLCTTWFLILIICTWRLKKTTRKIARERHNEIYDALKKVYNNFYDSHELKRGHIIVSILTVIVFLFNRDCTFSLFFQVLTAVQFLMILLTCLIKKIKT